MDGKVAIGLERGEGGGDTDEVFSILPRGCGKALVCGVGERLLVVGMPKGVKDISGQEAVWLSQLVALPISAH